VPDCTVTPFAIQPGQVLMPENCGVALRVDGPAGTWFAVWRPAERQMLQLPAPEGWLAGAGLWTEDGVLQLPYATREVPCGVARLAVPRGAGGTGDAGSPGVGAPAGVRGVRGKHARGIRFGTGRWARLGRPRRSRHRRHEPDPPVPVAPRPVPLREAPLKGRVAVG
jgi:hypothetical protein